jgi:hypothetical protein
VSNKRIPSVEEVAAIHDATCKLIDALRLYAIGVQGNPAATMPSNFVGIVRVSDALERLEELINPGHQPHGSLPRRAWLSMCGWSLDIAAALELIYNATERLLDLLCWQPMCEGIGIATQMAPTAKEVTTGRVGPFFQITLPPSWRWPELPESIVLQLMEGVVLLRRHCRPRRANTEKLFPKGLPSNVDIVDLVCRIHAEQDPNKGLSQIAREFTEESEEHFPKAKSLLSQIRRQKREGRITL